MPSESKLENQISKIENLKIEKNPPRKISESQSAKRIFQIRRLRSCRSRDSGSSFLQIVKGLCLKLACRAERETHGCSQRVPTLTA
jgi:hypothetical protein